MVVLGMSVVVCVCIFVCAYVYVSGCLRWLRVFGLNLVVF